MGIFDKVKQLIAKGETAEAIDLLKNHAKGDNPSLENDIVLLEGRFRKWEREAALDVSEDSLEKIHYAILKCIDAHGQGQKGAKIYEDTMKLNQNIQKVEAAEKTQVEKKKWRTEKVTIPIVVALIAFLGTIIAASLKYCPSTSKEKKQDNNLSAINLIIKYDNGSLFNGSIRISADRVGPFDLEIKDGKVKDQSFQWPDLQGVSEGEIEILRPARQRLNKSHISLTNRLQAYIASNQPDYLLKPIINILHKRNQVVAHEYYLETSVTPNVSFPIQHGKVTFPAGSGIERKHKGKVIELTLWNKDRSEAKGKRRITLKEDSVYTLYLEDFGNPDNPPPPKVKKIEVTIVNPVKGQIPYEVLVDGKSYVPERSNVISIILLLPRGNHVIELLFDGSSCKVPLRNYRGEEVITKTNLICQNSSP